MSLGAFWARTGKESRAVVKMPAMETQNERVAGKRSILCMTLYTGEWLGAQAWVAFCWSLRPSHSRDLVCRRLLEKMFAAAERPLHTPTRLRPSDLAE